MHRRQNVTQISPLPRGNVPDDGDFPFGLGPPPVVSLR